MNAKPVEMVTYRVTAPLIQIQGHVPFNGSNHELYERHLRKGDIVPFWVPEDEVARLLATDAVEAMA